MILTFEREDVKEREREIERKRQMRIKEIYESMGDK